MEPHGKVFSSQITPMRGDISRLSPGQADPTIANLATAKAVASSCREKNESHPEDGFHIRSSASLRLVHSKIPGSHLACQRSP